MKGIVFTVKDLDIATGGAKIILLNEKDSQKLDLHSMDRIRISKGKKTTIAALNIAESRKAVAPGKIGLFEEVIDILKAKHGSKVKIRLAKKPQSIKHIKKKLDGKELNKAEIFHIVKDIVNDELTSIELTSYVIGVYTNGMSKLETKYLTQAMKETGTCINFRKKKIVDLHCIGGVPGNRTTMIVVPILAAAGLKVPKTSSRAITSPSGTADTMEVLCKVDWHVKKLKKIINTVGGFIMWAGNINLAPSDSKIIQVEKPLSIDAVGQMVASIMAKKASVGATHLYIDIPVGIGAKVKTRKKAEKLKKLFMQVSHSLGIKIKVFLTDGSHPIGNGIGPALEAMDCLWVLLNDSRGSVLLRRKSLKMAGAILEFVGKASRGKGLALATHILESGRAYSKMQEIIKAQGGKMVEPESLPVGKQSHNVCAWRNGVIRHVDNPIIARIARLAGAPHDIGAGIFFYKERGNKVKKGEIVYSIIAENKTELEFAVETAKLNKYGIVIR